jgi:hypothetical protein
MITAQLGLMSFVFELHIMLLARFEVIDIMRMTYFLLFFYLFSFLVVIMEFLSIFLVYLRVAFGISLFDWFWHIFNAFCEVCLGDVALSSLYYSSLSK